MSPIGPDRHPRRRSRVLRHVAVASAALVLLSGCSTDEAARLGMPDPASEEGDRVLNLWQGSWVAALLVGLLVWGLIIWSVIFFRKRSDQLPLQTRYNIPIEVLYTILPLIVVSVLFYFSARDQSEQLARSDEPDNTIGVVGRQWSWTFNYIDEQVYEAGTPGEAPTLYLPLGETVRFELTSTDVVHSFWVPAFLFKMDVVPGRQNEFELTPNKLGRFSGKCAELCGVDHSRMLFWVEVVTPEEYDKKIAEMRANGQTGLLETGRVDTSAGIGGTVSGREE